ncbi:MAG: ACT domain-containing protein [Ruminococcaceae bacterium]|nr:ACT domain-containing protein [Oscillospiraceae bacterium]MBQ3216083.1 ACT domain-containing protein [Oscillospiraceae bacterium]
MKNSPKYYIVDASALPEVFLKVAEAKRLLATGQAGTVNEATKITGISRSAFYKYRDAVQPFQKMNVSRVITFQFLLHDEPGVLSTMLTIFAQEKTNLLTINSITPSNGCAIVTITAETTDMVVTLDEMLHMLSSTPGVIKAEVLAG